MRIAIGLYPGFTALDEVIQIDEAPSQPLSKRFADTGFSGAHETDERYEHDFRV